MRDVETLKGLLSRVEAATGPSNEIDADLYAVQEGWDAAHFLPSGEVQRLRLESVEGNRRTYVFAGDSIDSHELPPVTDSLDYSAEMVGKVLPAAYLEIGIGAHKEGRRISTAFVRLGDSDLGECWEAATAPLAVCAALLTALIAQAQEAPRHGE